MELRDFLYMDVDRLKSALAQFDSGLLESVSQAKRRDKQVSASAEGKIAQIVGVSGGGEFLWSNEQAETRTLHDSIYNLVEAALDQEGHLLRVPGEFSSEDIAAGALQESLGETSFVLIDGYAVLNDFAAAREFLSRINDVGKFVAYASTSSDEIPRAERAKLRQALEEQNRLPKELINGLDLMFEVFYKHRIVVKLRPLVDDPMGSLVGVLRPEFLREPIDVLTYKYGMAPSQPWSMLAQIASIPTEGDLGLEVPPTGGDIERSMMTVLESMRSFQAQVQMVTFPEIAVTPIAIYRRSHGG